MNHALVRAEATPWRSGSGGGNPIRWLGRSSESIVYPCEEAAPSLLCAFVLVGALVAALLEAHLGTAVAEVDQLDGNELVPVFAGLVGDGEDQPLGSVTS